MWKVQHIFLNGRLTLVNTVLFTILTSWMSVFEQPKWVSREIGKIRRNFLWKGWDIILVKCRLVSWNLMCKSKEQGEWGVLNLIDFNHTLLRKWWSKFASFNTACWSPVVLFNNNQDGQGTYLSTLDQLGNRSFVKAFQVVNLLFSLELNPKSKMGDLPYYGLTDGLRVKRPETCGQTFLLIARNPSLQCVTSYSSSQIPLALS